MEPLTHIIYCSEASHPFKEEDLASLLWQSRINNTRLGITGMLLYADNVFFQVLEGDKSVLEALLKQITKDQRHQGVTLIIEEAIASRSFADWSMGYANLTEHSMLSILGIDPFSKEEFREQIFMESRALKLVDAFKQGQWRKELSDHSVPPLPYVNQYPAAHAEKPCLDSGYTFAFQPILHTGHATKYAEEALIRGSNGQSVEELLQQLKKNPADDMQSRIQAILLAAHLGITSRLALNIQPNTLIESPDLMEDLLEAIEQVGMEPEQIILEILENELIPNYQEFRKKLAPFRRAGFRIAIDDFGVGYAGLNLLTEYQPDLLKMDKKLIENIHHHGPRQAIVRGVLKTCNDLGIDVVAECVETQEEYQWLRNEGIALFQGYYFAKPAFESLTPSEKITPLHS